jgi:hypothetical protein
MVDIDNLIAQLESTLAQGDKVDKTTLESLTKQYCEVAGDIAKMVSRCAAWVDRGLFTETVSVADDYPRLLEVANKLAGAGADSRLMDLAKQLSGLNTPEAIAKVLQPYAPKGVVVPVLQPAWMNAIDRAERELERSGDQFEKYQFLSISRASCEMRIKKIRFLIKDDPSSRVWPAELERVEIAALENLRAELRVCAETGDFDGARKVAAELNHDQWSRAIPEDLRMESKEVLNRLKNRHAEKCYAELEQKIRDAGSRANEPELVELEEAWVRIQQDTGVLPSPESDRAVEGAFQWLEQQRVEREQALASHQAVELLEQLLEKQAPEQDVSRQFGQVQALDQVLPPGLEARVTRYFEAIRSGRRRKIAIQIAAAGMIITVIAAGVWWQWQRSDTVSKAIQVAVQVDAFLNKRALLDAEKLLLENESLAKEAPMIAVAARVKEAKPAWEKDREAIQLLLASMELAIEKPVAPAQCVEFKKRVENLKNLMTDQERKRADTTVLAMNKAEVDYMADKHAGFIKTQADWKEKASKVVALDALADSERWNSTTLKALQGQAKQASAEGVKINQDFSEISSSLLAPHRIELERIQKLDIAISTRLAQIDVFQNRYNELVSYASDTGKFNAAYDTILNDCSAILNGMNLANAFRKGREASLETEKVLKGWSDLLNTKNWRVAVWESSSPVPVEMLESITTYIATPGKSEFKTKAQRLLDISNCAFRENTISAGTRMSGRIISAGIPGLWVVPLKEGGRLFRRKIGDMDKFPFGAGVIQKIAELETDPKELEGLKLQKVDGLNKVKVCAPTSKLLSDFSDSIKLSNFQQVRARTLDLIAAISTLKESPENVSEGRVFRLWTIFQLAQFWQDELSYSKEPTDTDLRLKKLVDGVKEKFQAATFYNWAGPATDKEALSQMKERDDEASEALKQFNVCASWKADEKASFQALADLFRPIRLGGAVSMNPFTKAYQHYGQGTEPFLMVIPSSAGSSVKNFTTKDMELYVQKNALAPTLVYSTLSGAKP